MRTDLFNYHLPEELIAQHPLPRGESRLMVIDRSTKRIEHLNFSDLPRFLKSGDTLVLNDTRVTARRLHGLRENGLELEVFLLKPIGDRSWEALLRPGKSLRPGKTITLQNRSGEMISAMVSEVTDSGSRLIELSSSELRDSLAAWGETPLPPYIHFPLDTLQEDRYQTVYADTGGSAAAPTAGLHFTADMLDSLQENGVALAKLTLEVGIGTFRPVRTEDIENHQMHAETYVLSEECAQIVNNTEGRIVAVGTTSIRTLEACASDNESSEDNKAVRVKPKSGETRLFITPGYKFRVVDALITNFHLPRSTLLMLIASFAGYDLTMQAYHEAIENKYRFFSFGDAMFIV